MMQSISDVQFNKSVLKNGVRVLTESHPDTLAVAVGVWIEVGTRDEPEKQNGLSHLIEHMVFKGTEKRSAFELARALEAVGGDLNAYTSREYTCFHATALKKDLSLCLDVLSDLVVTPAFPESEFEREKNVILQEIYSSQDLLEEYAFDLFFQSIYPGNPSGWPILGTEESVSGTTREDMLAYFRQWYVPQRVIVTVVGDVQHEEVVQSCERYFQFSGPRGSGQHQRTRPQVNAFRKTMQRPAEQIHVLMGWPASTYRDDLRFESYIINCVLGGGMTSRLYQRIREERGLAYTVYSYLNSHSDAGLSMVYAATQRELVPRLMEEMSLEIQKLRETGLTEDELNLYRNQVKGQILLGSEDIENRMSSIGVNEMIYGSYRSIDYVVEQIDRVSVSSIRCYLDEHFDLQKAGVYLLGDVDSDIEKLVGEFSLHLKH